MAADGGRVVSLSGGVASAIAAERVIERFGADGLVLWVADTKWEDEDLWRFAGECAVRWGLPLTIECDGRTPLEVAEDRQIIPNQRRAPCSFELKQRLCYAFVSAHPKPLTLFLGLDWMETHRMERPRATYEEIPGVRVEYPLAWEPTITRDYFEIVEKDWGIEVPRLYKMGFKHNNCGGRCVRQGIKGWQRLGHFFPDRFDEVRDWEQQQRGAGGARANYAICRDQSGGTVKPVTLAELEKAAFDPQLDDGGATEDLFGCLCSY